MNVVARLDVEAARGRGEGDEGGWGVAEEVTCLTCLTFLLADEKEEEPLHFFLSFFLSAKCAFPPPLTLQLNDRQPVTRFSGDIGESFTDDADKNKQTNGPLRRLLRRWTTVVGLMFNGTISFY